jgi:putative DNA primase/helicase
VPTTQGSCTATCTAAACPSFLACCGGHRALPYVDGDGVYVGRLQAVLAPILAPDGTLVSAQRIYADRSLAERKKVLPPAGTIKGGAIRLFDVSDEIGVGEGVETCIAAHELFGLPTWATISADNLVLFDPPAGVTRVTVFGDNDENFVGQASAYALARRLALKGYDVAVEIPTTPGTDWLDALADRRLRGAA